MTAADPTPTPQTSPVGGTKPDAGEPVTVTSEDRNVAMSVAYKLAVQDVTHDDQYRHEAAKIVALHRQQAVAEATADALRTIVELSDANIKAESSRDELAALESENVKMRELLAAAACPVSDSDGHNQNWQCQWCDERKAALQPGAKEEKPNA